MIYRRSVQGVGAWASKAAARAAVGITLTVAAVLVTSSSALAISATCGEPVLTGTTSVVTCSYTDSLQTFTVPAGVHSVSLDVKAAQGGNALTSGGGAGGEETGTLPVSPGDTLTILTGGAGTNTAASEAGTPGGYGGGGDGADATSPSGGDGGAGGGGGGGIGLGGCSPSGGTGGGDSGGSGKCCAPASAVGAGATQHAGGAGALGSNSGSDGLGPANFSSAAPFPGQGGPGGKGNLFGGGGGGGGYYGGGGGAGGAGGGGGGSGYRAPTVTDGSSSTGVNSGNGVVTIAYATPNAPAITSAAATTFTSGQSRTFTVTTTGTPAPTISDGAATLPPGVTFKDNGNGTATLSGIPTGVSGGYPFTITASNGVTPDATQSFTLYVSAPCPAPKLLSGTWVVTCPYTGGPQTFTVPQGFSSISLDAKGAGGGSASFATGGAGGEEAGTLDVSPGETLTVISGGAGAKPAFDGTGAPGDGGYGGGAAGGNGDSTHFGGAGGGGGSFVYDPSNLLVIAAGGGGGGAIGADHGGCPVYGGSGGGDSGASGCTKTVASPGGGGTQNAAGAGGPGSSANGSVSGANGDGPATWASGMPAPGTGGTGSDGTGNSSFGGGGGGGGYYGGGGGAGGGTPYSLVGAGSAGGGSGYRSPAVTNGSSTNGVNPSNGVVTITYTTLTVSTAGNGSGTVTSAPAGINCGSTCSTAYAPNTSVTLTAHPAAGSSFAGWSGAGCSGTGPCVVNLDASQTTTATFAKQSSVSPTGGTPSPPTGPTSPRSQQPICRVVHKTRTVPLTTKKHKHTAGRVALTVSCNQNARLTVTGKITEFVGRKPNRRAATLTLGPVHGQAKSGRSYQLSIKLPRAAVSALASRTPESLALTITAGNGNGKRRTTVTIVGLRGVVA